MRRHRVRTRGKDLCLCLSFEKARQRLSDRPGTNFIFKPATFCFNGFFILRFWTSLLFHQCLLLVQKEITINISRPLLTGKQTELRHNECNPRNTSDL